MARLKLLPVPKSVRERKGSFRLADGVPVVLAPSGDTPGGQDEVRAAWSFAGEAERKAGVGLSIERMGKFDSLGPRVLMLIAGRDEKLYPPLRKLAEPIRRAPKEVRDQAYVLEVTEDEIVAAAASPRGLYYAAQTLRQLVTARGAIPCVRIADWPAFVYRGVMLDISRFKVPTLEALFERIERLASLKVNVFQLYTEHTFVFRRHPEVGKDCGSMSAEDILRLDEFCKDHFVELQANLQSFGHHASMLALPKYNALAEVAEKPWTLTPVDKRTYALLDDLYSECLPAYSSKLFNASCDETWDLGKGRSAKQCAKLGIGRVYLGHIQKINRLARKYGKRMMIWADIVLKHADCIPDIPADIIMLDWGYDAGQDLRHNWKFVKAGLEHWTCPGVSTWSRLFANIPNACGNITERAVMGQKTGAPGLLNTDWGDGGHPQMPSGSFHGYAWGAEQSWTPNAKTDRADFDARFAWAWFADESGEFGELYAELGQIDTSVWKHGGFPAFHIYWDEFPSPYWVKQVTEADLRRITGCAERALDLIRSLSLAYPRHHEVLIESLFAVQQVLFVVKKARASARITKLREQGAKRLPADMKQTVRELLAEWIEHRETFEEIWMAKNRRSEIAFRLKEYRKRERFFKKLLR